MEFEAERKSRDSVIKLIPKKKLVVVKHHHYHPVGIAVPVADSLRVGDDPYHAGVSGEPFENRNHYGTHATVVEHPHYLDTNGRVVTGPNPGMFHPTVSYSRTGELTDGRRLTYGMPMTVSVHDHEHSDEGYNTTLGGVVTSRAF